MKHPIIDRILIFINAALVIAAAVVLALTALGVIPAALLHSCIDVAVQGSLWQKIIVWACTLVLAVCGLVLLGVMLPGRNKHRKPFATIEGENGAVNISIKALEGLVHKCLQAHPELTVVSSSIFSDGESVRITLHITLMEDISIPLAVNALQKEIRQYVQGCAGVEIDDVRVFVDGTTAGEKEPIASPYRVASSAQPLSAKPATAVEAAQNDRVPDTPVCEVPAQETASAETKETPAEKATGEANEEEPSVAQVDTAEEAAQAWYEAESVPGEANDSSLTEGQGESAAQEQETPAAQL